VVEVSQIVASKNVANAVCGKVDHAKAIQRADLHQGTTVVFEVTFDDRSANVDGPTQLSV
jgi:hypothetical protein